MKFLCDQCKAKYQIADDKIAGKTVRMKCRKCGHQIEVRAAITETSVASKTPDEAAAGKPGVPRPTQKPASPKLATTLTTQRPGTPRTTTEPPQDKPGALAGAFTKTVQREEEISASFDLMDLSTADEWYVAINGVPVGPVRIGEVRRKAAIGAVTEDSLVWQEGLEEWRPVRAFAELAEIVREAATTGRTSLMSPQPPDARTSVPPSVTPGPPMTSSAPQRPQPPTRPSQVSFNRTSGLPGRPSAVPGAASGAAAARSNVVPITSRLATAERLDEDPAPTAMMDRSSLPMPFAPDPFADTSVAPPAAGMQTGMQSGPSFAPGAYGNLSPATGASIPAGAGVDPFTSQRPPFEGSMRPQGSMLPSMLPAEPMETIAPKRETPWLVYIALVLAAAFGVTAAVFIFQKAPIIVNQLPPQASATPTAPTANGPVANADTPDETANPTPGGQSPSRSGGAPRTATPTDKGTPSAGGGGGLDISALKGNRTGLPDDPSRGGAPTAGNCYTASQVQSVLGMRQPGIKRACYERGSQKGNVKVSVQATIGPGGNMQSVSASSEDPAIARCVENDVRRWSFPAGGCSQQTAFSINFVAQ